jgi:hypothetical protein
MKQIAEPYIITNQKLSVKKIIVSRQHIRHSNFFQPREYLSNTLASR